MLGLTAAYYRNITGGERTPPTVDSLPSSLRPRAVELGMLIGFMHSVGTALRSIEKVSKKMGER